MDAAEFSNVLELILNETPTATQSSLMKYLESEGYKDLRMIRGDICGTMDYLTTRGIVVGMNSIGYERRYCYQSREEATAALEIWDGHDHPPGNWIKLKGTWRGDEVDMLNPNFMA